VRYYGRSLHAAGRSAASARSRRSRSICCATWCPRDGRSASVDIASTEERSGSQWLASLGFSNTEVATGEILYEMQVGGIFRLEDGLIAELQAFPSVEEAAAALGTG
jgi:hypothetical protein